MVLFPHEAMRPVQRELVGLIDDCVKRRKHCIVHAPTGLGKTAAALAPALTYALDHDCCVVFVTPRHTQHLIALKTARAIKDRHNVRFGALVLLGRQHMCAHDVAALRNDDFGAYCRGARETGQCKHYARSRTTNAASMELRQAAEEMQKGPPVGADEILAVGKEKTLCPYELALTGASTAKLVITDYHFLFSPSIAEKFLAKIGRKPEQLIIIVDEGHNLPGRVRSSLTSTITGATIKRALMEAKEFGQETASSFLAEAGNLLQKLGDGVWSERLVEMKEWSAPLASVCDVEERDAALDKAVELYEEARTRHSAISNVLRFCQAWDGSDGVAFARILTRTDAGISLTVRCLDPSIATGPVIASSHCTILMSGTLRPTRMFRDLLGFPPDTVEREFTSPFPQENKLSIVATGVTTKFSERSDAQYRGIASRCAALCESIPGCVAIFFPSYAMLETVQPLIETATKKTVFREASGLTREERASMLARFASYKDSGALLMGVASGSFGEGVDLPGVLSAVIVVGVPLEKPNLETQQLIQYYDTRFGRGWDYGYTLPALMRTLQNAGRCIRSETDRGVLVFMDDRYAWDGYRRCFADERVFVTADPLPLVRKFFAHNA